MPASYATEKLIKFELPDGRIFSQIDTSDKKYLLAWKRSADDDWKVVRTYKTKQFAEKDRDYYLKIGWGMEETQIIQRTSKQYLKDMTDAEYYETMTLLEESIR